jgi:hypothetical protein
VDGKIKITIRRDCESPAKTEEKLKKRESERDWER